ncbi:MAG: tRNA pseudouridine(55) synthase TruB [Cyanobacteria bacterium J06626_14]
MDGFINLNKPQAWTSHDCVAKVRRLLRQKKVGHAGTLDPAAVGVLPIAIGRATRLLQFLKGDKAYRAVIRFGIRTATDDLDGDIVAERDASLLRESEVIGHLPRFHGTIQQIPPSYSAIQVDGKRLYELARQGKAVDVPVRTVQVNDITTLAWHPGRHPQLEVAIACGSGTYIRAIARDLGECVGTGATLAFLERTESSGFHLSNSITLDELEHQIQHQEFLPMMPDAALTHLPPVHLPDAIARRWRMGQKVPMSDYPPVVAIESELSLDAGPNTQSTIVRVYESGERFLGIGEYLPMPEEMEPAMESKLASPESLTCSQPNGDSIDAQSPLMLLRPRMVFVPV